MNDEKADGQENSNSSIKSISDLLTIIIITSPLPSHPATTVLEAVLDSHAKHCPVLLTCRKVVVFDGYKVGDNLRLKKGNVTQAIASGYEEYKLKLKKILSRDALPPPPDKLRFLIGGRRHFAELAVQKSHNGQTTFIEPNKQIGCALAIRAALDQVDTPYVFVQQHDWAFCDWVPLQDMLTALECASSEISTVPFNYITFNTRWTLNYSARQTSNDPALEKMEGCILRSLAEQPTSATSELFRVCTPLFHWLDRPHIARASIYREHIFNQGLFSTGDFVEDVFGQKMVADIRAETVAWNENDQEPRHLLSSSAWLGCWLWEGQDSTRWPLVHLQGRTFTNSTPGKKTRELNIHGGLR
jgi:hypothetical protein